jgi:UDP-N-acetylmuramoyl-tripeptide--D-alanyl-D-alanine ligase
MMMLNVAVILEALSGIRPDELASEIQPDDPRLDALNAILNRQITGGVADSRQAYAGALFVALPGEKLDGHDFVHDAFEHGAGAAFVERDLVIPVPTLNLSGEVTIEQLRANLTSLDPEAPFCIRVANCLEALQKVAGFWRAKLKVRVIGITGSVGKSTTKEVVADVLGRRFRTLRSPGNLNNEIGLPLSLLSLTEEHERAVLEMGFYFPGEIAFLCKLARPEIGVVTNIGTVHAERAGSQETIALGKSELVQALPAAPLGFAVLNYDDPRVRSMAEQTKARVFYYGLSTEAKLWADEIEGEGLDGISFRLHYRGEKIYMHVPLIGRHSVHTALRAAAVGLIEGLSWQGVVEGLHSERTQLRLVTVRSRSGALILDDTYNASPESTLAALNLLEELDGRKIAVLGDMLELGIYEEQGHEEVGARAAEVVDELVTFGQLGKRIAYAAWQAGLSKKSIATFTDHQQVVDYLNAHLKASDVVLVKGSRGMQMDRIVSALEARG